MHFKKLALVVALAAIGPTASLAATYAETGDAGQSLATAQTLGAGIDTITGAISGDADMFGFSWGGGSFYVNTSGSNFDTQLFLFNAAGAGVWANDDGLVNLGSYLEDPSLASGMYYLAVSGYNNDPVSASGVMFTSSPYTPQYGPLYPGQALSSWSGDQDAGSYSLNFRSASGQTVQTSQVPEPASLALLGLGLAGLAATRRKHAK